MNTITKMLGCAIVAGICLTSCGDGSDVSGDKEIKKVDVDLSEFKGESMKKHGINAIIMLPDETSNTGASVVPSFDRVEDHLWKIEMGPRFEMEIEDFGDQENALAAYKSLEEATGVYEIEYLVDEPTVIMYKRKLKYSDQSDLEVQNKPTYHCAGSAKIDGINYIIRSGRKGTGFKKPIIEEMVKTIRSFQPLDLVE